MNNNDELFDEDKYKEEINKTHRPWNWNEIPVGVKMRDVSQPNAWFGMVTTVLPGASNNYNRPIYCTLLEWCKPSDLLENLEYTPDNGTTWLPCGVPNEKTLTIPELIAENEKILKEEFNDV